MANLPKGLYILLALISFFLFDIYNDFPENNYLRIRWTDFHQFFSPNDRYFFVDDRSGPLLSEYSRDVAMETNFRAKFAYMHSFGSSAFQNGLQYRHSVFKMYMYNGNILATFCANLIKIGPVMSLLHVWMTANNVHRTNSCLFRLQTTTSTGRG